MKHDEVVIEDGLILINSAEYEEKQKLSKKELKDAFVKIVNKEGVVDNGNIEATSTGYSGERPVTNIIIKSYPKEPLLSNPNQVGEYYLYLGIFNKHPIILNREQTEKCFKSVFGREKTDIIRKIAEKETNSIDIEASKNTIKFINNKSNAKISVEKEDVKNLLITNLQKNPIRPEDRLQNARKKPLKTGFRYDECMCCGISDFDGSPLCFFYSSPFTICERCQHKFLQNYLGVSKMELTAKII